jgi:hypothetical protein
MQDHDSRHDLNILKCKYRYMWLDNASLSSRAGCDDAFADGGSRLMR